MIGGPEEKSRLFVESPAFLRFGVACGHANACFGILRNAGPGCSVEEMAIGRCESAIRKSLASVASWLAVYEYSAVRIKRSGDVISIEKSVSERINIRVDGAGQ